MKVHVHQFDNVYRDFTPAEVEGSRGQDQPVEELEIVDLTETTGFSWDDEDHVVSNLVCVGVVGIEDPVRDEVSSMKWVWLRVIC